MRVLFSKMLFWMDSFPRSGPEAMAVDEWLLETVALPVLRVYAWQDGWGSIGYFGGIASARATFPGVNWVRRWTGGGMVDHRRDWTYTLVVPQSEAWARLRGGERYQRVHSALAETLHTAGISARLSHGNEETGAAMCFENPVACDLIDSNNQKLAGAGQRRSRHGVLHQGSVALACQDPLMSQERAESFAKRLAREWTSMSLHPHPEDLARRVATRYASEAWTNRR